MSSTIGTFIVGIVCIFFGISNMKGNLSSLHSYHRHRVSEEDRIPFGKKVGLGTVIAGGSIVLFSIFNTLTYYLEIPVFALIGSSVLAIGLVIGLGISFYAMFKYNKGIF
ncbi:MAG: hypothetical protein J6Q89_01345 [Clostridia bacterium]|nr:hypothetical protein [Clostridia bacterium]